jgi:cell division transport system ATP-binding protein
MAATEQPLRRARTRRAAEAAAAAEGPQRKTNLAPADPNAVIQLRGVSKTYESGDIGLEQATFSIAPGEFVFLVGHTGSGKSTIMRLLLKELEPSSGSIMVAGRDLTDLTRKKIPYYRRNLGVVFQDFKLLPNRTVYDNVAYALQVTGHSRKDIRAKVPDVLRLTGLSTKLHNYPDQLSGGEKQRVSVARAFVNHPPLLLADEPTGNLDPETSIGIMQLLYRINRAGTTVLVATHDSAMVDRMRRRVIEVQGGRVIRDELAGGYAARDENTAEFGALMRGEPAPAPQRIVPRTSDELFDDAFREDMNR